jgi:hypothetical protein
MGHCYEFAVSITAGCGHAMTVSATGGVCECPICGARCEGRFDACESILRRPGYVPAFAPAWAVEIPDAPPNSWDTSRTDPNGVPAIEWRAPNGASPRNGAT